MTEYTNVPVRGVRGAGTFTILAGIVMVVAGIAVWILVAAQLSAENITVSEDSQFLGGFLAGQQVQGPLTAYAQADIINHHALEASGGATYAELAQDDPVRDTVMDASFLRASLFTSVVAFGICALVVGLGIVLGVIGGALRRLGRASAS
jgi:ABC-type sugar transport system permease subunit